jgi:hypothetical protein
VLQFIYIEVCMVKVKGFQQTCDTNLELLKEAKKKNEN